MRWKELILPPAASYTSLIEVGKYNLIWNVSLVLIPVFLVLFTIHLVFGDVSWLTSLCALVVCLVNIYILQRTRKYVFVGWFSVLLGILICQIAIFVVQDSRLLADAMWCILIAFFTFFLFGNLAGLLVLLFNLSGLIFYQFIATPEELAVKGITVDMVDFKMAINVYYVAFALAFIIGKMQSSNRRINASYEEQIRHNELLFKEVHHRVKNNLQIMASLLRLQASESDNKEVVASLQAAVGRVTSMAFIHESMYKKNKLQHMHFQEYAKQLLQNIIDNSSYRQQVSLDINGDDLVLNPDSLVSLSLLLNELGTNSLKHAFKEESGIIHLSLKREETRFILRYRDSGKWIEAKSSSSFGKELIITLCEHLEGEVCRNEKAESAEYSIEIPAEVLEC